MGIGFIELVADPLVEDGFIREEFSWELESEVEVPSVLCVSISIEFVATACSLEASAAHIRVIKERLELEFEGLVEVLHSLRTRLGLLLFIK